MDVTVLVFIFSCCDQKNCLITGLFEARSQGSLLHVPTDREREPGNEVGVCFTVSQRLDEFFDSFVLSFR